MFTPSRFFHVAQSQGLKHLIRKWDSVDVDYSDTMRLFPSENFALIFGSGIELRSGGPIVRDIFVYSVSDLSSACKEEKVGTLDSVFQDSYVLTKDENYLLYVQIESSHAYSHDNFSIGSFRLVIVRISDRTKFVSRNSSSSIPMLKLRSAIENSFLFDDGRMIMLNEMERFAWK
jgi:hypothetical protein